MASLSLFSPVVSAHEVLIAEDDAPLRKLVAVALKHENIAADTAADGEDAIRQLEASPRRVLVLDLMMPNIDGWEVIRWLKEHPEHRPHSVIVLTAVDRGVLHQLDPDVVNAIIFKPFDAFELAAYVRACVAREERDRRRGRPLGLSPGGKG
jgi:DNA-binding response OmpR family regulator